MRIHQQTPSLVLKTLLVATLAFAGGCGGSGSGGDPGAPGGDSGTPGEGPLPDEDFENATDVEISLNQLGIDTSQTPRLDDDSNPVPESFAPFGASFTFNRLAELFTAGFGFDEGDPTVAALIDDVSSQQPDNDATMIPSFLAERTEAQAPWIREESFPRYDYHTLRAFAAADVDGNGLEEVVGVYAENGDIKLRIMDDVDGVFADTDVFLTREPAARCLTLESGDFDGDGVDELVLAISDDLRTTLLLIGDQNDGFSVRTEFTKLLTPAISGSRMSANIAVGNLDQDRADEFAVVLNEVTRQGQNHTFYWVYDDEAALHVELRSGLVEGLVDGELFTCVVADLAIGDIDGDHLGELVLGGMLHMPFGGCSAEDHEFLMIALDDIPHGFASLDNRQISHNFHDCESHEPGRVRYVHVNVLDIDGDFRQEVQINHFVFEDWFEKAPWSLEWEMPDTEILGGDGHEANDFDRSTSALAIGDYNGDSRDDILIFRQSHQEVRLYSFLKIHEERPRGDEDKPRSLRKMGHIDARARSESGINPVLVMPNVDKDSASLRYSSAEHRVVFTEPLVLAALAAPPCSRDIGQNLDACVTSFGNTKSEGSQEERSVTVSASATVGVKIDGGAITQSEAEFAATATAAATSMTSEAYDLSRTVIFTTGPVKDTIVFSTLPMDQYIYTVMAHPDASLVGQEVVVSLPRSPIVLQVEREFYNNNVVDGALRIDRSVFTHVEGDHRSYMTRAEKNRILDQNKGIEAGPQSVGQGSGNTTLQIDVSEEYGSGQALELGFEVSVQLTVATVMAGFSVGVSESNSMSVTAGSSSSYTGSVGDIDGEHFFENQYSFGMFTYVQTAPSGHQFEVINYWVE